MKSQTINLKFSLAKTKALSHYLEKEGMTIEGELTRHLNDVYSTQVPETVQEFLASQFPDEENTEDALSQHEQPETAQSAGRKKHSQQSSGPKDRGPVLAM